MDLYPHQRKAVDELKNGSILWGGVGTGKSRTAVAYYMKKEIPRDVYVITTARKRDSLDWNGEFAAAGIGTERNATVGGLLTVDSWNNLHRYREVREAFFVFDEQRLVGSGEWTKNFLSLAKRNRWILLSATPGDTWLDYIPVFIANGFYKNRSEFKREHVVYNAFAKFPKVERYTGVGKLVRHRNALLVEMPYLRHTTRVTTKIPVDYDKESYEEALKKRWHPFENRPIRDVSELFIVARRLANSHPSRLDAVRTLLTIHPRLIVFYNFDYELETLRSLATLVDTAEWSGDTCYPNTCDSSTSTSMGGDTEPCTKSDSSSGSIIGEQSTSRKSNDERLLTGFSSKRTNGSPLAMNGSSDLERSSFSNSSKTKTQELEKLKMGQTRATSSIVAERSGTEPWQTQKPVSITSLWPESRKEINPSSLVSVAKPTSQIRLESQKRTTSSTPLMDPTSTLQVAEWNGHKHEPVPSSDRWVYLVQYMAGSEAWNCVDTDAICFYSLTYSYKMWHQAHGRIDRLNTPFEVLRYYILLSKSSIDQGIWRALASKKDFNVSQFSVKNGR